MPLTRCLRYTMKQDFKYVCWAVRRRKDFLDSRTTSTPDAQKRLLGFANLIESLKKNKHIDANRKDEFGYKINEDLNLLVSSSQTLLNAEDEERRKAIQNQFVKITNSESQLNEAVASKYASTAWYKNVITMITWLITYDIELMHESLHCQRIKWNFVCARSLLHEGIRKEIIVLLERAETNEVFKATLTDEINVLLSKANEPPSGYAASARQDALPGCRTDIADSQEFLDQNNNNVRTRTYIDDKSQQGADVALSIFEHSEFRKKNRSVFGDDAAVFHHMMKKYRDRIDAHANKVYKTQKATENVEHKSEISEISTISEISAIVENRDSAVEAYNEWETNTMCVNFTNSGAFIPTSCSTLSSKSDVLDGHTSEDSKRETFPRFVHYALEQDLEYTQAALYRRMHFLETIIQRIHAVDATKHKIVDLTAHILKKFYIPSDSELYGIYRETIASLDKEKYPLDGLCRFANRIELDLSLNERNFFGSPKLERDELSTLARNTIVNNAIYRIEEYDIELMSHNTLQASKDVNNEFNNLLLHEDMFAQIVGLTKEDIEKRTSRHDVEETTRIVRSCLNQANENYRLSTEATTPQTQRSLREQVVSAVGNDTMFINHIRAQYSVSNAKTNMEHDEEDFDDAVFSYSSDSSDDPNLGTYIDRMQREDAEQAVRDQAARVLVATVNAEQTALDAFVEFFAKYFANSSWVLREIEHWKTPQQHDRQFDKLVEKARKTGSTAAKTTPRRKSPDTPRQDSLNTHGTRKSLAANGAHEWVAKMFLSTCTAYLDKQVGALWTQGSISADVYRELEATSAVRLVAQVLCESFLRDKQTMEELNGREYTTDTMGKKLHNPSRLVDTDGDGPLIAQTKAKQRKFLGDAIRRSTKRCVTDWVAQFTFTLTRHLASIQETMQKHNFDDTALNARRVALIRKFETAKSRTLTARDRDTDPIESYWLAFMTEYAPLLEKAIVLSMAVNHYSDAQPGGTACEVQTHLTRHWTQHNMKLRLETHVAMFATALRLDECSNEMNYLRRRIGTTTTPIHTNVAHAYTTGNAWKMFTRLAMLYNQQYLLSNLDAKSKHTVKSPCVELDARLRTYKQDVENHALNLWRWIEKYVETIHSCYGIEEMCRGQQVQYKISHDREKRWKTCQRQPQWACDMLGLLIASSWITCAEINDWVVPSRTGALKSLLKRSYSASAYTSVDIVLLFKYIEYLDQIAGENINPHSQMSTSTAKFPCSSRTYSSTGYQHLALIPGLVFDMVVYNREVDDDRTTWEEMYALVPKDT
jgi:hypothetical protein